MNNTFNFSRIARRVLTILMVADVVLLSTSIICLEAHCTFIDVLELHEAFGFTFLGLVSMHLIMNRKSLKNAFSFKSN